MCCKCFLWTIDLSICTIHRLPWTPYGVWEFWSLPSQNTWTVSVMFRCHRYALELATPSATKEQLAYRSTLAAHHFVSSTVTSPLEMRNATGVCMLLIMCSCLKEPFYKLIYFHFSIFQTEQQLSWYSQRPCRTKTEETTFNVWSHVTVPPSLLVWGPQL